MSVTMRSSTRKLPPPQFEPGKNQKYIVEGVHGLERHGKGKQSKLWVLVKWEGGKEMNWVEHSRLDCDDLIAEYVAMQYLLYLQENKSSKTGMKNISNEDDWAGDETNPFEFGAEYGFDRCLSVARIIGATEVEGRGAFFLVKWNTPDERILLDVVSRDEANKQIPQNVIKFYQERIQWNRMVFSDSEDE